MALVTRTTRLDVETLTRASTLAERLDVPQIEVLRRAVRHYERKLFLEELKANQEALRADSAYQAEVALWQKCP